MAATPDDMRRPIQSRAQATIDRICVAALSILEEGGWDAFNTNAVAARAGVAGPTVYRYFPDKYVLAAELRRRLDDAEELVSIPAVKRIGVDADLSNAVAEWVQTVAALRASQPAVLLLRSIPRSIPDLQGRDVPQGDVLLALADSLRRRQPTLSAESALEHAATVRVSVDSLIDQALQSESFNAESLLAARGVAVTLIAAITTEPTRQAAPLL